MSEKSIEAICHTIGTVMIILEVMYFLYKLATQPTK